jgi:hypothetical protein
MLETVATVAVPRTCCVEVLRVVMAAAACAVVTKHERNGQKHKEEPKSDHNAIACSLVQQHSSNVAAKVGCLYACKYGLNSSGSPVLKSPDTAQKALLIQALLHIKIDACMIVSAGDCFRDCVLSISLVGDIYAWCSACNAGLGCLGTPYTSSVMGNV